MLGDLYLKSGKGHCSHLKTSLNQYHVVKLVVTLCRHSRVAGHDHDLDDHE